jgi:hypothetical protein
MSSNLKEKICISSLEYKEDTKLYEGLIATSHLDRGKDILSKKALDQIKEAINRTSQVGDQDGAYRWVSLSHDWIKQKNPDLDAVGYLLPTAELVELKDGHYGVKVQMKLNDFYRGDMSHEEIKQRIEDGFFGGFSIEYSTDDNHCRKVMIKNDEARFIDELTGYGGTAIAQSRKQMNPYAVMYKELEPTIEESTNEKQMEENISNQEEKVVETMDTNESPDSTLEASNVEVPQEVEQKEVQETVTESTETKEVSKMSVKELLQNKEFKEAVLNELKVDNKVIQIKEESKMESSLSIKEMNEALSTKDFDSIKYNTALSMYFKENTALDSALRTVGVPLHTSLDVKCEGTKLRVVGQLQFKDTLNSGSNTSTYTQNSVEFADTFVPGLVDTFNNQTNLFGAVRKVDNVEGSNKYGWRITTSRQTTLSVDPDDSAVSKTFANKLKLQTEIKEYRLGVSVSDYTLYHSRASMGDLFRIEVEKAMRDVMKDINRDMFTEQADGTTKILGLEAVADSAGNTTLYGLTRSTANRLAPDSAADTYQAIGGAISTAKVREAARKVEVEGAMRSNLRFVVNPSQRDALFELEDGNIRYLGSAAVGAGPALGFNGAISYDGIPVIVDPDCQSDALFCVDFESYYVVVSRAPQVIGLAKVGAAEEAYVSVYLASVYEQPRRIHMLDTLS